MRQAVVMFIANKNKEVLFVKRASNRRFLPGVWALPSGHIKKGEGYKEATVREAHEELNIVVHKVDLIMILDEPSGDNVKVYLMKIPANGYNGMPIINTDEFENMVWLTMEDFYKRFKDQEIGSTLRHLRHRFYKNGQI